jgi:hypothetical protein
MTVEDYRRGDDAVQWSLERPSVLIAKLRNLVPGGCSAVIDAVERVGQGGTISVELYLAGLSREIEPRIRGSIRARDTQLKQPPMNPGRFSA